MNAKTTATAVEATETEGAVATVTKPTKAAAKEVEKAPRVNLFQDTTQKLEAMTKTKLVTYAAELSKNIDENSFRLGGALQKILENGWFDPYADFKTYVKEVHGFEERKARYLIEIYKELTFNLIPWDKVKVLGWTKLKELVKLLTVDNVDEWVTKASELSVTELQKVIKGTVVESTDGKSTTTTSDTKKLTFTLKNDQIDTVNTALAHAKAQINTEFDNAGLEFVCAQYMSQSPAAVNVVELLKNLGTDQALKALGEAFPEIDLNVSV